MKVKSESEVAESCLTLSDPMDCSPAGSPVHGIFQVRVLEWGAIAFSNDKGLISKIYKQFIQLIVHMLIQLHWYIYTMEYNSAIKSNAFESVLMRWLNLEPMIQSEMSQKEKDKYHILPHIWNLENWY